MKYLNLLLVVANSDKIIKNINIPSCKNCVYFKPNYSFKDFASTFNECEKFGEKNIITNQIEYNYVDQCRKDELLCGAEAKYFIEEKNINLKILKHRIFWGLPIISPIIFTISAIIIRYIN